MPVPTYDHFIAPLLQYLASRPEGAKSAEAHSAVSLVLGLTEDDREERVPSGVQPVYKNRNGWAQDRLKRAGLTVAPRWGYWSATDEGRALASLPEEVRRGELEKRLAAIDFDTRLRPSEENHGSALAPIPSLPAEPFAAASPDECINLAVAEVRDRVSRDLLERIAANTPKFFEHLVLDLLHAMGYGTSRSDAKLVGGSGDGGIDGIISIDRLGLEKVYVQAKRWKGTVVGSPEIQGFMGALQLHNASKGVFITTSEFSRPAVEAASRARGGIVLVDGAKLTSYMMDFGIGIHARTLRIPDLDNDYFDEE